MKPSLPGWLFWGITLFYWRQGADITNDSGLNFHFPCANWLVILTLGMGYATFLRCDRRIWILDKTPYSFFICLVAGFLPVWTLYFMFFPDDPRLTVDADPLSNCIYLLLCVLAIFLFPNLALFFKRERLPQEKPSMLSRLFQGEFPRSGLSWWDGWLVDGLVIRGSVTQFIIVGELARLWQCGSVMVYLFLSLSGGALLYFGLLLPK
jgi:hypothetical protein